MLRRTGKLVFDIRFLCIQAATVILTLSTLAMFSNDNFELNTITEREAFSARPHKCVESPSYLGQNFIICILTPRQDSYISGHYFSFRRYDAVMMEDFVFAANLYSGSYIIDVGSNLGPYSLVGAAHGHRVIAVDPIPSNQALLFNSIVLNNFGHLITQIVFSVSDVYQNYFPQQRDEHNPGKTVMTNNRDSGEFELGSVDYSLAIKSVLFQDILDLVPRTVPVIIKMDIEGFECKALNGFLHGEKTHFVPYIMMENINICEDQVLCPDYKTGFLAGMESSGYKPYSPEDITYEDMASRCYFYILFVHEAAKPLPFLPKHGVYGEL